MGDIVARDEASGRTPFSLVKEPVYATEIPYPQETYVSHHPTHYEQRSGSSEDICEH